MPDLPSGTITLLFTDVEGSKSCCRSWARGVGAGAFRAPAEVEGMDQSGLEPRIDPTLALHSQAIAGLRVCNRHNESRDHAWKPEERVRRNSNPCGRWRDRLVRLARQRTRAWAPLIRSCSCERLQARSHNCYLQFFWYSGDVDGRLTRHPSPSVLVQAC
jgi:hypothetical protein